MRALTLLFGVVPTPLNSLLFSRLWPMLRCVTPPNLSSSPFQRCKNLSTASQFLTPSLLNTFNSSNFSTPPTLRRAKIPKRPRPTTGAQSRYSKSGTRSLPKARHTRLGLPGRLQRTRFPSSRLTVSSFRGGSLCHPRSPRR